MYSSLSLSSSKIGSQTHCLTSVSCPIALLFLLKACLSHCFSSLCVLIALHCSFFLQGGAILSWFLHSTLCFCITVLFSCCGSALMLQGSTLSFLQCNSLSFWVALIFLFNFYSKEVFVSTLCSIFTFVALCFCTMVLSLSRHMAHALVVSCIVPWHSYYKMQHFLCCTVFSFCGVTWCCLCCRAFPLYHIFAVLLVSHISLQCSLFGIEMRLTLSFSFCTSLFLFAVHIVLLFFASQCGALGFYVLTVL